VRKLGEMGREQRVQPIFSQSSRGKRRLDEDRRQMEYRRRARRSRMSTKTVSVELVEGAEPRKRTFMGPDLSLYWNRKVQLTVFLLGVAVLMFLFYQKAFVLLLFSVAALCVGFFSRMSGAIYLGVEFGLGPAIFIGYVYGPFTGGVMGLVLLFMDQLGQRRFSLQLSYYSVLYVGAGLLSGLMQSFSVFFAGVLLVVLVNVIAGGIHMFARGPSILYWYVWNIVFNLLLFKTVFSLFAGVLI